LAYCTLTSVLLSTGGTGEQEHSCHSVACLVVVQEAFVQ